MARLGLDTVIRRVPWLLRRSLLAAIDDGLFGTAKGAAYSALLSFFPILTSAATILVQVRADYVQQNVATFLREILPPGTEDIVLQQFRERGQRPTSLIVIALLLSVWAASSVIKSLIDGFNAAYRVPKNRTVLAHIGIGLALVVFAGIPLLGASVLMLFGGAMQAAVMRTLSLDPVLHPLTGSWLLLSQIMRWVVAYGATASFTAVLYYYGTYRKQQWSMVWPGALVATTLSLIANLGFGWYVRNITNYNLMYGSVGTSIALLSWMYILALIQLYGCEFNAEAERLVVALGVPGRSGAGAPAISARS